VTTTGDVYFWGKGVFGELRSPQEIDCFDDAISHIAIGDSFGIVIDEKGHAYSYGSNDEGQLGTGSNDT